MTSPTNPKSRTYQFKKTQTKRLIASFEGWNSSLAQLPGKLWSCKVARK